MSIKQIYEGWKNHVMPAKGSKKYIDMISKIRMEVCEACEFHSKNGKSMRPDVHCMNCGCTLAPAKTPTGISRLEKT